MSIIGPREFPRSSQRRAAVLKIRLSLRHLVLPTVSLCPLFTNMELTARSQVHHQWVCSSGFCTLDNSHPASSFGFSPAASQLLTVPPYVFASMSTLHIPLYTISDPYFIAIVTVGFALLSDRTKYRFPFILAGHAMCILGFGIQISNAHSGVKYFGTFFCVAGSYSAFPGVITWCVMPAYVRLLQMAI